MEKKRAGEKICYQTSRGTFSSSMSNAMQTLTRNNKTNVFHLVFGVVLVSGTTEIIFLSIGTCSNVEYYTFILEIEEKGCKSGNMWIHERNPVLFFLPLSSSSCLSQNNAFTKRAFGC